MSEQHLLNIYLKSKIGVVGTGQMGTDILLAFEDYIANLLKKYNDTSINSKDIFFLADIDPKKKTYFNNLGFKNFVTNEEVNILIISNYI